MSEAPNIGPGGLIAWMLAGGTARWVADCEACGGTGISGPIVCGNCDGTGEGESVKLTPACSVCGRTDDLHVDGADIRCHPCRLDDDLARHFADQRSRSAGA